LSTAIHYNTARLFVLRFMTHAEYDRDTWKDSL
jgi:mRNA interferase HigB